MCFVDNDVILKLTACDLFWEAIASLGCEPTDVNVLSSAKFIIRGSSSIRSRYGEPVCDQSLAIIQQCQPVRNQPNNPYLNLNLEDVDVGELLLAFEAMRHPNFILTTGDKRFLKALSQIPELADVHKAMMGRVICFEQAIAQLIKIKGFEVIRDKVTPARECDVALKAAFGSGLSADPKNAVATFRNLFNPGNGFKHMNG